jgi:predicted nicotinamide N-methyase
VRRSAHLDVELVATRVSLPHVELDLLQPAEAAELPDDREVEWAPVVPYWSVLWRSGVALGRELGRDRLDGLRVVELGCGMGVPSLAASAAGAKVLATDSDAAALELLGRNASRNGLDVATARVDWASPASLTGRAPFDLVLAGDVLYERPAVALLLDLLPRLGRRVLLADPGRPAAGAFLDGARRRWRVETRIAGVVRIHSLALSPRTREPAGRAPRPRR